MISGLVIHLTVDEQLAEEALREIDVHPAIEAGERQQTRLPVVCETADVAAMHELTDWLVALKGVNHVDVTFAGVEAEERSSGRGHESIGARP